MTSKPWNYGLVSSHRKNRIRQACWSMSPEEIKEKFHYYMSQAEGPYWVQTYALAYEWYKQYIAKKGSPCKTITFSL